MSDSRKQARRRFKDAQTVKRKRSAAQKKVKPRPDKSLNRVFKAIGRPDPLPFKPDPFQLEALKYLENFDVLVNAATGSGKTWIASQAIHSFLSKDQKTWYASPLKALSNSIYNEFCHEFGQEYCGIITGDRKENVDAPVIIGTTEILRNQLYDAMHEGRDVQTDLVILDEAHYLNDPFRGVVWEEVLIYLPTRIRLLLLSATISNDEEICEWLREIRGRSNRVVRSEKRPVPLESIFLFPDGRMVPLGKIRALNPSVKRFVASRQIKRYRRSEKINFGRIISWLREFDLLPAIFFLKSRADCDKAVFSCPPASFSKDERKRMEKEINRFLKEYPHLNGRDQLRPLLQSRVGSHHGGQLPYWKVLIEKMMAGGYLEAIFSTSTVAAGVNFPARTVALVQSDRYNGREFIDLSATDLHQMIGRAGRRGKDRIGFVMIVPGVHQNPELIHELIYSSPEPINSQIHINFSMTLNLLLSQEPKDIKKLLERSLAAFQERGKGSDLKKRWEMRLTEMAQMIPRAQCDIQNPKTIEENIGKVRAQKKAHKINNKKKSQKKRDLYAACLEVGRIFSHKNGKLYAISACYNDHGRMVYEAYKITGSARDKKKGMRPVRIQVGQIKQVYNDKIKIRNGLLSKDVLKSLKMISPNELVPLYFSDEKHSHGIEVSKSDVEKLDLFPCYDCAHWRICHGSKNKDFSRLLRELLSMVPQMEGMAEGLWISFNQHLRFLVEAGFADKDNRLTQDGIWASKLRLDQPLLIAEAIRNGAFENIPAAYLAAGLAPFVWDRSQEIEFRMVKVPVVPELERYFERIINSLEEIIDLKTSRGFENQPISFWPTAALYLWAKGASWEQLTDQFPVNEGDLAALIVRTADHLRQVINLAETHPELASLAKQAIGLILREPVYIY